MPPAISLIVAALLSLAGCVGSVDAPAEPPLQVESLVLPAAPGIRTLTPPQYRASVADALGVDVPVAEVGQWPSAIAAARGGFAPATVRDYEQEARAVAQWVFDESSRRDAVVGCDLQTDTNGSVCKRFWRGSAGARSEDR